MTVKQFKFELNKLSDEYYSKVDVLTFNTLKPLIDELKSRYPKRNITMKFVMGTFVVDGFSNTRLSDNYGNLESYRNQHKYLLRRLFNRNTNHPLLVLIKLMDELFYIDGLSICIEDL